MLVNFPADVRNWLIAELNRGTPAQAISAQLQAQNIPSQLADALVSTVARAVAAGVPPPAGRLEIDDTPFAALPYQPEPLHLGTAPILDGGDRRVDVLARLERPTLALLGNLLDDNECAELIAFGAPRLEPVRVVDPESGQDVVDKLRNSEGVFFHLAQTPLIARIEARIERLTGIPAENGEGIQLLRYRPGAQHTPHFDFLSPAIEENRKSIEQSGQRIATLIMYLNNVESGGETLFNELGFSVLPRKGNALYFQYGNRLGQTDHASAHAGMPVVAGEKWIATKWLHPRRFIARGSAAAQM
ncbi:2OG-Fe(II) oxygenase [Paraburkholderia rhizosphaerae]|uniref:Prolyl 4-hydroxylase n=1 Tax=Paraburkholderia rhizosphaerae TaxID=480658 RepID=A0A4R8LZQ0_9BURK|nr:2OG-Fe(II) oxygenase [Paraburkholderia rhizosphaerae]TDY52230.1 prolyl 4-hydroxylase [Paraburkholderia rhizosphaerae]